MDPVASFITIMHKTPERLGRMASGVSEEQLHAFQDAIGLALPTEFVALYRHFDGTRLMVIDEKSGEILGDERTLLPDRLTLCSLARILSSKANWDGLSRKFEAMSSEERRDHFHYGFWHRAWIPFLSGDGRQWALATEPCFGGPSGQVVSFDYNGHDYWDVEHESFADWLRTISVLIDEDVPAFDPRETEINRRLNPNAGFIKLPPAQSPAAADLARFSLPRTRRSE
jgi:cell wall assembly regulator SMI1